MEEDPSKLHLTFKKIIECSDEIKVCCSESAVSSKDLQKRIACRSRIAELLRSQLQLSLKALSCVNVRRSLSETIRMKCHDEKNGEPIGSRGLSEILQLIDDYADSLPLYVDDDPLSLKKRQRELRAANLPVSASYPPLVGSVSLPNADILPIGNLVAVWKKEVDQRESKWILAEVIEFKECSVRGGGKRVRYTLLDHVAEFEYYRDHFINNCASPVAPSDNYLRVQEKLQEKLPFLLKNIQRCDLIPLPCFRADPRHHSSALFGTGSIVMARFPKTSVFYRACVIASPKSLRDGYHVTFDLKFQFNFNGSFSGIDGVVQSYVIPQLYVVENPSEERRSRLPHEYTPRGNGS